MTTESRSTADLLLESLKARRKHHRTQQVVTRVSLVIRRIDTLTGDRESSSLQELFDHFMIGETDYFPEHAVKRILWLLGDSDPQRVETSVDKALRVLQQHREQDDHPENRNPDVDSIVPYFRGPVGLEGCWLGGIDNYEDIGVRAFRSFLYGIENVIADDTCEMHEMFYFINKNILDIADALVATEDEDDVDLDGQAQ